MTEIGTEKKQTKMSLVAIEQRQRDRSSKVIWSHKTTSLADIGRFSWSLKEYFDGFSQIPKPPWHIETATAVDLKKEGSGMREIDWSWAFTKLASRLSVLSQLHGAAKIPDNTWKTLTNFFSDIGATRKSEY